VKKLGLVLLLAVIIAGCGDDNENRSGGSLPAITEQVPLEDNTVLRGRAEVQVESSHMTAFHKFIKSLIPYAYAATGVTTVTYTNAAAVNFTVSIAALGATGFTGDTLDLGHIDLATIDDNHLKVCGVSGNQKCNTAIIRVYTTGSVAGFVNTTDGSYGMPVYAGSLNPSSAVGLNPAGAVQVQTVAIAPNKNRLRMVDFPSPQYNITSDFSNAGSGDYSMDFVVEYVLSL
jgi:hypothetical protein